MDEVLWSHGRGNSAMRLVSERQDQMKKWSKITRRLPRPRRLYRLCCDC